ncbi:MAG TPA: hypothetical protein VJN96_14515 [Vicinamibacterales bacterium]|nr:hypothetical protein [Vicinamibacterales bacterium]
MRILSCLLAGATLVGAATPSAAQTATQGPRSERPYRGLFAGDTGNAKQLLTLSASFGGGYDDDIFASGGGVGSNTPLTGGSTSYISGSFNLGYSMSTQKLSFSARFGSGTGYYPGLSQPTLVHHSAGVGLTVQTGRHSSLSLNQSETYQPFFFYTLLPVGVQPVPQEPTFDPANPSSVADASQATILNEGQPVAADAVAAQHADYYLASETDVSYSHELSQRLHMNLGYGYRRSDSQSGIQEFTSQSGAGTLSYSLAKGLSLRGGYTRFVADYPQAGGFVQRYTSNNIDAGLGYAKALSISRRTSLSFSTGTSAVSDTSQVHYALTGNVQLTREIGRTWSAGAGYNRGVSFIETFRAPVLADSFNAGIGGLLSRNLQVSSGVGVSRGRVGFTANNNYQSTFVSAGLRYAFSRHLALNGNYAYYRYTMDDSIVLAPGVARQQNRQSFGFSVETWLPLIQRNRSANASR